jgi:ribonuclease III
METFLCEAVSPILSDRRQFDPKSLLQEWVQSQGFGPPVYRTVGATGPEHDKTFEVEVLVEGQVYGQSVGHSKQTAAKAAARNALENLGIG